jgi:glyoxylase-like metal-dependent hydrolase (beta-lactamase superfamily II)
MSSETFTLHVGGFKCMAISDGVARYPAALFFANIPKEQYEKELCGRGESPEIVEVPYTCLYIDTGRERVLVDTGAGHGAPTTGKLLHRLRAGGIEPRAIGTVILSHAHPDHVGGVLDERDDLAFPNARYFIWKEEWDFWLSRPDLVRLPLDQHVKEFMVASAQKNLSRIGQRIELLTQERQILPGISAISAPGHTPGHMAIEISSRGEHLLYLADAVCHLIHLEYPETSLAWDLQPRKVVSSRRQLLGRAAREMVLVHSFHFPFPGLGHVTAHGEAWRWRPLAAES